MKRKTVPQLVKKYAEEWRAELFDADRRQERGEHGVQNPLRDQVKSYLDDVFRGLLDAFMGIERSFDINLKTPRDGAPPTIAMQLLKKAEPHLLRMGAELFAAAEVKLTKKDTARLQRAYHTTFVCQLEEKVEKLARARVAEIAENELDRYMADDEWIAIMESRHGAKNVKEDDD